jgi:hypothetical protein
VLKARSRLAAISALCLPCAAAALSSDLHLSCLPIHLTFLEIAAATRPRVVARRRLLQSTYNEIRAYPIANLKAGTRCEENFDDERVKAT